MTKEKALISMGYRRLKPDEPYYGKPVSTSMFIINIDKPEFCCWFIGAQGKHLLWARKDYTEDSGDFLNWIKHVEGYYTKLTPELPSNFEFLSLYESLL